MYIMSLATDVIYRTYSKSKRHTLQRYRRSSSYKVVMCMQKLHHFCNTSSPADSPKLAESTWKITNYGRFINQFPPNIIRSIRQFERINKKICRQKLSIIFNEICIKLIYIYVVGQQSFI